VNPRGGGRTVFDLARMLSELHRVNERKGRRVKKNTRLEKESELCAHTATRVKGEEKIQSTTSVTVSG
jgi:hypothetical protein